jgi:predicted transcriptional regulator
MESRALGIVETRSRSSAVTIRMSDEEVAMLKAIAEAKGLSVSDVLRQYVRREHEKLAKQGKV